ncbi:MAG: protein translocase subunit SecD, partial [Pseudomonadota bacterium]
MNKFPLWKNLLLLVILFIGIIYALPNIYGEDPAIQITGNSSQAKIDAPLTDKVKSVLTTNKIPYREIEQQDNSLIILFENTDTQLKAISFVKQAIGNQYTAALNLIPATPDWLRNIGAEPVKLGLDLRGGIHFLLDVDVGTVVKRRLQGMVKTMQQDLRGKEIRYADISVVQQNTIRLLFRDAKARDAAYDVIRRSFPNLMLGKQQKNGRFLLITKITPAFLSKIRQYTIEQTLTTLRNRVNELGIAEPIIQQQGADRISVDLPGVQDSARAKQILGGTATLEFHLVDAQHDVA